MTVTPEPRRVAVVVAHPGHELIVYRWMEEHRPIYCCLTDGSGGGATSRLSSTTRLLNAVGASAGEMSIQVEVMPEQVQALVATAEDLHELVARFKLEA